MVQDKSSTNYHCNLRKPRKLVIPASMAACVTAACTVDFRNLLSYNSNDILPSSLVGQSLATTTDSMLKHITEQLPCVLSYVRSTT